ncbi:oligosaccharide repeat unit polymerase [Photobacterium iliopiscarium]|uniref:Oligosaccharide repeat unit polymerase n=1 Tax=Photobacterium iliopiscarium TaxID=56192 RepID=A0A2T3MNU3_9GAMM|nr:oligosaccharide repeat unit polymerase [Photobacterium iliopiscarium]PSV98603.1 hypothetical protein C9I88_04015 [Photobacterium iliopiscarium]
MVIGFFTFILVFLVLCYDLYRFGYKSIINPFFILLSFFFIYMVLPSIFTESINYYYYWSISLDSMLYGRIVNIIVSLIFIFLLFIFPSGNIRLKKKESIKSDCRIVTFFWVLITFYLFFVIYKGVTSGVIENAFEYDSEMAKDPYKVKNLAYLLVSICSYLFFKFRRLFYFSPMILIIIIDFIYGSRTSAFICLVPMIVCLFVEKQKIDFLIVFSVIFLLLIIGVIRSDNIVLDTPWYLNILGEIRETFITLPLYIDNSFFIGNGNFISYLSNFFAGIIYPLRGYFLSSVMSAGTYIYLDVGRGYGLASNFIIESIYYGWFYLLINLSMLIAWCLFVYKIINKLSRVNSIILMSYFIVFIRLTIREGVPYNLSLFCFILLFYWLSISLVLRISCKYKSIL